VTAAAARFAIDLDVKIGALDVYGKRINEVSMRGAVDAAGWSVMLTARELAGNLSHRSGQLIARLTHLQVPEDYPGAKPQEAQQPKDLPAVDLITERLSTRRRSSAGSSGGAARRGGLAARQAGMGEPRASLPEKALASRQPVAHVGGLRSRRRDLRQVSSRGLCQLVKGGKARLQGSSRGRDPLEIDYPSLSGHVQMQAEDGQFSRSIRPGQAWCP